MKILIFNGGKAIVKENSSSSIMINGEKPKEVIEATKEAITEHFPNVDIETTVTP